MKGENIMTTIGDFINIAKQVIEYIIELIQTYFVKPEETPEEAPVA